MKTTADLKKKEKPGKSIQVFTILILMLYGLDLFGQQTFETLASIDAAEARHQMMQFMAMGLGLIVVFGFAWYLSFKSHHTN